MQLWAIIQDPCWLCTPKQQCSQQPEVELSQEDQPTPEDPVTGGYLWPCFYSLLKDKNLRRELKENGIWLFK